MNLDDPKLTAYALDEVSDVEKTEIETALAASPAAQEYVRELRAFSGNLRAEYAAARTAEPAAIANGILALPQEDDPWTVWRRLALAAAIALLACLGALALGTLQRNPPTLADSRETKDASETRNVVDGVESIAVLPFAAAPPLAAPSQGFDIRLSKAKRAAGVMGSYIPTAEGEVAAAGTADLAGSYRAKTEAWNTAAYRHVDDNSFLAAWDNPLSTFSIDVDTASYANVRRFLASGTLPPKDAVRLEEMINYFHYDYPQPPDDAPFSINLDAAGCPWAPAHRLLRVGLQGRELPNEKRPPSNLVFLLDVSGSMNAENRLPLVKQAMRLLVEKLGENDRVAVVVYAGGSGIALPSTAGDRREQIFTALENLQAGGSTNGAQGIELAYRIAADHFIKGGVNRVLLATDGDFNIGTTSEGELVRLIQEKAKSGVFLSVLGVGDNNLNDSMMQQLADKGNGNYAYLDSLDEARKVLVRQINGTLVTIAKDVKIQVEFNPAQVASYRLIGYEKRQLRKEDFNNDKIDAGEIGAGHTVTALYEVVPASAASDLPGVDALKYQHPAKSLDKIGSAELCTVKLRYKEPDGDTSKLLQRAFVDRGAPFANAAPDLKFAAAVAEFGMILRDSEFKGNGSLGAVAEWAQEGKGADTEGYRTGFLELVRKAGQLKAL